MNTAKNTAPSHPFPKNCKVIYLRDKMRRPVGCVVYRETWGDGKCRIDYGYSSLARRDQRRSSSNINLNDIEILVKKKGGVSPTKFFGRAQALLHLENEDERKSGGFDLPLTEENVRTTKSGRTLLVKEAVLSEILSKKIGSETFRSRIHDHMKYMNLGRWPRDPWKMLPKNLKQMLADKFGSQLEKKLKLLLEAKESQQ